VGKWGKTYIRFLDFCCWL